MTIDIHFSCATMEELREAMQRFLSSEDSQIVVEPRIQVSLEPDADASAPAGPAEEPAEPATVPREEALAALHKLRREKGSEAVKAVLLNHGVDSFTKLNPNDYAKVLEEARQ